MDILEPDKLEPLYRERVLNPEAWLAHGCKPYATDIETVKITKETEHYPAVLVWEKGIG